MERTSADVYSDEIEGPYVMFLTGMRMRGWRDAGRWWRVALAMEPMVEELNANRGTGFLRAEGRLTLGGVEVVQYWRSFEHMYAYVHGRGTTNLPAWAKFQGSVGEDGAMRVWHETRQIAEDWYLDLDPDVTPWGLFAPGAGGLRSARRRTV